MFLHRYLGEAVTCEVVTCPQISWWFQNNSNWKLTEMNWNPSFSLDLLLDLKGNQLKVDWHELDALVVLRFLSGFKGTCIDNNLIQYELKPLQSVDFFDGKKEHYWNQININWNPYLSFDIFKVQTEHQLKVDWHPLKSVLKLVIWEFPSGVYHINPYYTIIVGGVSSDKKDLHFLLEFPMNFGTTSVPRGLLSWASGGEASQSQRAIATALHCTWATQAEFRASIS